MVRFRFLAIFIPFACVTANANDRPLGYELRGPITVVHNDSLISTDLDGAELFLSISILDDVDQILENQLLSSQGNYVVTGTIAGQPLQQMNSKLSVFVSNGEVDAISGSLPVAVPDNFLSELFLQNGIDSSTRFNLTDSTGAAIASIDDFVFPDGNLFDTATVSFDGVARTGVTSNSHTFRYQLTADVTAVRIVPEPVGQSKLLVVALAAGLMMRKKTRSKLGV